LQQLHCFICTRLFGGTPLEFATTLAFLLEGEAEINPIICANKVLAQDIERIRIDRNGEARNGIVLLGPTNLREKRGMLPMGKLVP
jgi:hypothetical protein